MQQYADRVPDRRLAPGRPPWTAQQPTKKWQVYRAASTHIAGVTQRVASWQWPDGEAVGFLSHFDLIDLA